jgi:hypothetical protein
MYIYHNENPQNWHVPDCVIRAITLALNIGYYEVVKMLDKNAQELSCECLNVRCYEKLLDEDLCFPHFVSKGRTAEEVAKYGYKKLQEKSIIAIPGIINKMIISPSKFTPRKIVRSVVYHIH